MIHEDVKGIGVPYNTLIRLKDGMWLSEVFSDNAIKYIGGLR